MDFSEALGLDFAVLGDPVSHSLSPAMHSAGYAATGLAFRFGALRVESGFLESAVAELMEQGLRGVNVTVPLKEEAARLSGFTADDLVHKVGAANTIDFATRSLYNTDGPGFLAVLEDLTVSQDARVLILGAGGSARTLAWVLDHAGYQVSVWNRTPEKAQRMLAELGLDCPVVSEPNTGNFGLVINATSAGLASQTPPMEWQGSGTAIDLVYGPASRHFLDPARDVGWQTLDGKPLLAAQGALSWEIWLQRPAPREAMAAALVR